MFAFNPAKNHKDPRNVTHEATHMRVCVSCRRTAAQSRASSKSPSVPDPNWDTLHTTVQIAFCVRVVSHRVLTLQKKKLFSVKSPHISLEITQLFAKPILPSMQ